MPLLKIQISAPLEDTRKQELMAELSRTVAEAIGKPEKYVMVALESGPILMGGESGPAAFVDIRSIGGLGREINRAISGKISAILAGKLALPPDRTYLNFTEVSAADWGYNGSTFG